MPRKGNRGLPSEKKTDDEIAAQSWYPEADDLDQDPTEGGEDSGVKTTRGITPDQDQSGGSSFLNPQTPAQSQSKGSKPAPIDPTRNKPGEGTSIVDEDSTAYPLFVSTDEIIHSLQAGEIHEIRPGIMSAMAEHLHSSPIFPSNGLDFKELFETYILINPMYLPVVEWMRAHPAERAAANGTQKTCVKPKKRAFETEDVHLPGKHQKIQKSRKSLVEGQEHDSPQGTKM